MKTKKQKGLALSAGFTGDVLPHPASMSAHGQTMPHPGKVQAVK
jgi:hypothetical protein